MAMIPETYPPNGNSRPDSRPWVDDEPLLEDLLLRLEELCAAEPDSTPRDLIDGDVVLCDRLGGRDDLTRELEHRWEALLRVDGLIFSRAGKAASLPSIPGYDILGELDRGGTAVVYSAWQQALNRPVAIKMLLAGRFASPRMATRFQAEATTIAKLHHPNIVAIHDRGQVDGIPFLVMERIDGGNLKTKLAGRRLLGRKAAELLVTLSQAVEYAHQQGIVHRDLKPSNVLLTEKGDCKISDFGLAKLIEADSKVTRTGELPGTPSYMAPEQASGGPVGPWTDVYALGAILYETLTGRPPFGGDSIATVLTSVRTKDPIAPRRLNSEISRDLETIVLKCLRKLASERYKSAAEMADELDRFLRGEPIATRPISIPVRAWRWSRRNPVVAGLVSIAAFLTISLAATATIGFIVTSNALQRERAEGERADANYQQSRAVVDRILRRGADELSQIPHTESVRQAVLQDAVEFYKGFLAQFSDSEDARYEAAVAYQQIGQIYFRLGDVRRAQDAGNQSVQLLEGLMQKFPSERKYQEQLFKSIRMVPEAFSIFRSAERTVEKTTLRVSLAEKLVEIYPDVPYFIDALAQALADRGNALKLSGQRGEAIVDLRRSLQLRESRAEKFPDVPQDLLGLGHSHHWLGAALLDHDERGRHCRRAYELYAQAVAENPDSVDARGRLCHVCGYLAKWHIDRDEREAAETLIREAIHIGEKLVQEAPSDAGNYYMVLAMMEQIDHHHLLSLGYAKLYLTLHPDSDRQDEVEDALRCWVQHAEHAVQRTPDVPGFRNHLVQAYTEYSRFLVRRVDVENRDHEKSKRLAQKAREARLESADGH